MLFAVCVWGVGFVFVPLCPTCRICDILCYAMALLSIAEKEPVCIELEVHQLGCPQKKSLRVWRPQVETLCAEGGNKASAESLQPLLLSSAAVFFCCFHLEDGSMQSFASMPIKPVWPQHSASAG